MADLRRGAQAGKTTTILFKTYCPSIHGLTPDNAARSYVDGADRTSSARPLDQSHEALGHKLVNVVVVGVNGLASHHEAVLRNP